MQTLKHRIKKSAFLTMLVYFPALINAQNLHKAEKEVYHTIVLIGKAWTENNLDTLEKYISKGYQHTDTKGQLLNRTTWLKYVKERKQNSVVNPGVEFDSVKIEIYNDLAFVTGVNIFSGAAYVGEKTQSSTKSRIRFTQVLQKQNGIWKRTLFQATYIED